MNNTEPYYRRKGEKFIIEQKLDGKTKYLKTLPDAKTLLELLESGRPTVKDVKASSNRPIKGEKEPQTFVHELLTEPLDKDAQEEVLEIPDLKVEEAEELAKKVELELMLEGDEEWTNN